MHSDLAEVRALLGKYREIEALRLQYPTPVRKSVALGEHRARLRKLSAAFPGALRQLERLPPRAVRARIEVLENALLTGLTPDFAAAEMALHRALQSELGQRGHGSKWQRALAGVARTCGLSEVQLENHLLNGLESD